MQKPFAGLFVKGKMISRLIGTTTKAHNRFVRNIVLKKITEELVQRMVGIADDENRLSGFVVYRLCKQGTYKRLASSCRNSQIASMIEEKMLTWWPLDQRHTLPKSCDQRFCLSLVETTTAREIQ